MTTTTIEAKLFDDVDAIPIFMAVNRVRPCADGLPNTSWTGPIKSKRRRKTKKTKTDKVPATRSVGLVTRSMTKISS